MPVSAADQCWVVAAAPPTPAAFWALGKGCVDSSLTLPAPWQTCVCVQEAGCAVTCYFHSGTRGIEASTVAAVAAGAAHAAGASAAAAVSVSAACLTALQLPLPCPGAAACRSLSATFALWLSGHCLCGTAMVLQEVMAAWYRGEHRPANALLEEADQARLQRG